MVTPAAVPVGEQSKLAAVQHAELPIMNALVIPRLLGSMEVHNVDLRAHGIGSKVNAQQ